MLSHPYHEEEFEGPKKDRPGGGPKTTSQTVKFHPNRSCDLPFRMPRVEADGSGAHSSVSEETPELDYRPEGLCS